MKLKKLLRWWEQSGRPRLLAVRKFRGVVTELIYCRGRLVRTTGSLSDWAWDEAPKQLERPFSGVIFSKVAVVEGKLRLAATGYHLTSTRLMNEAARRRLLTALGFLADEGSLVEYKRDIRALPQQTELLVDDLESRKSLGRSAVLT
ncbi:MAG: hypothetical protein Q8K86_05905 [Candidatus Nanopelagicaceae bacterium]|nr:hypothetical protein [Candidatus Nanopelagicaceae bacterium]